MRIKIISDVHLEFWNYTKFDRLLDRYLPPHAEDKGTVLVVAGDIGLFSKYSSTLKPFFDAMSKRFAQVVACPGNHEWYHSTGLWGNEQEILAKLNQPVTNIWYQDGGAVYIKGVWFLVATLWTDFNNSNAIDMMTAARGMNDFECIRKATEPYRTLRLQPEDTVVQHKQHVDFLERSMRSIREAEGEDAKIVVVTHHAPSHQSIGDKYKGDSLNPAFASDLEDLILTYRPQVWAHGHMHDSKDYMIGDTRVICNPLGYHAQAMNPKFNDHLVVEV